MRIFADRKGKRAFCVRFFILFILMFAPMRLWAVGWTPTDAGLAVNFQPGDRFLLSVMIDGTEYFVCHYPGYTGGKFSYKAANELRLIPQAPGATVPSDVSVWTVDTALTRIKNNVNYALGGISYTMWSSNGYTLMSGTPTASSAFKFLGHLSNNKTHSNLCDVVFVVPTVRATANMDPNGTLNASHTAEGRHRGDGSAESPAWAFDGKTGRGFADMVYREVYWFDIPRFNTPNAYTNASLVTFNTTLTQQTWSNGDIKAAPGTAGYAFADNKHKPTPRMLFRLYVLGEKAFTSCDSYFFGWDTQDYLRYRQSDKMTDFGSWRKIFTLDHMICMSREGDSKIYKSDGMQIPPYDSTYFYVGKDKEYKASDLGSVASTASVFTKIKELRVDALKDADNTFTPSPGAYGRMVVDTTSAADNLGVTFEPAGYFLKVSTGKNIRLFQTGPNEWICDEMWTITSAWAALTIKATLQTGPVFRDDDPGADIEGWSEMVVGTSVPVVGGGDIVGVSGMAIIHTNDARTNGYMEFVPAETSKCLKYNNYLYLGAEVPDQYPLTGQSKVVVKDARLKEGFTFLGWSITPGGEVVYHPGDIIDLPVGITTLYAKATFSGTYNVAFSFMQGGKRYFLTQPTQGARFARARHFDEWTNVRQGMADAYNSDPNYVSTYKMIGKENTCEWCTPGEYVLDPMRETLHGFEDSLTFYEDWSPQTEEFLGLYYTTPNTLLTNDTWAGLFQSTEGWPNYATPAINSTKLFSTHYLHQVGEDTLRSEREFKDSVYVKYNAAEDQFDGATAGQEPTDFQISAVVMADAHYVILPDTTDATTPWTNEITFGYHTNESTMQQVWSKLIGKQLMACMMVGIDTTYFHPNRDKTITNANELRLSQDYRLTHTFQYLYDKRAAGRIAEGDSVIMEETENGFCCNIYSGASSPMDVTDGVKYIDIEDTLRVWLRPAPTSKIKDYYGRWKKKSDDDGLTVKADGSRYRDILITTKTYHYGPIQTRLVLKPEYETYNFSPLAAQSQDLNFTLEKQIYRQLYDADNSVIREDIIASKDTTTVLNLASASCTLAGGSTYFSIGTKTATSITLTTQAQNLLKANRDTLHITFRIDETDVPVRVPLMQAALTGTELVWSVVDGGKRYFIMAKENGLIYREFTQSSLTLYKKNTTTKLIKGSYDAANSKDEYITPWTYSSSNPITLKTELPVNKYFTVISETTPGVGDAASELTYEIVRTYANDDANYEEQVYLKYGSNRWLRFKDGALTLTDEDDKESASLFSWSYLMDEYNLLNNGAYPNLPYVEFGYNSTASVDIKTAYKAYHEYSMLLDNKKVYVCRNDENTLANLIDADKKWKTTYAVSVVPDARDFDGESPDPTSGLIKTPAGESTFTSTITPSGTSPMDVKIGGKYVDIVDTLQVTIGLQGSEPTYHFKGDWSSFNSISDANLKIPLVRKTYHSAPYDSIVCLVENEEYNFAFPSTLREGESEDSLHTFYMETIRRRGTNTFNADGEVESYVHSRTDTLTELMELNNPALAEIRLVDEYGNKPDWCEISEKGTNTVTMRCKSNGIRTPRSAHLYFVYVVTVDEKYRYVNFHLTVSQASLFQYANNQTLIHSPGASGDPLMADGRQQVHENKRILYYYNPEPYNEPDQDVELPVRERGFYGWWRWYREGTGVADTDIPDSMWIQPPRNVGKFNYPFRIIGDSVPDPDNEGKKKLVTMGRYTVFHYPAVQYASKNDPPAKSPKVKPPYNKDIVTYVVDLGAYYDNLPLSMAHVNQIDTAVLDTMQNIIEPTLSLREIFELHPWTEMAAKMENYKTSKDGPFTNEKYMEDHEVMAPLGNKLLLKTEQRYRYDNLAKKGHSESLLGYYMRDDNWDSWDENPERQDTMIWCGGWDATCMWFTYKPGVGYGPCNHPVTVSDDFLEVPAKTSITSGQEYDTVYYCLRARSMKTTRPAGIDLTVPGDYWFNICRYKIIYHNPRKFGPLQETTKGGVAKALITNDEIEQNYEILERLNFDYVKPGKDYQVYPHPLPWADGSYGYSYPVRPDIPDNRYHNDFAPNFPGVGEYGLINRIPYANYWHKMEQHGGAENGYMIYCDGMNSAGQVAALSLETKLCEGQKMYFSAYVGNPSNQSGKSNPNFTISVQGSGDGAEWEDITTYTTGDIKPSNQWSQIYFPIKQKETYNHFRVRIYNMASDFDGNDFIIDDMCVFATKPPLIAYQANTKCVDEVKNDSIIHVVLRVDYQGFIDTLTYNGNNVYYTVQQTSKTNDTTFVPMLDGYINQAVRPGVVEDAIQITPDTVFGHIPMPAHNYVPTAEDSIFTNLSEFVAKFDTTFLHYQEEKTDTFFNKGYLYENLDGVIRPVLYVIHNAKMTADNTYTVRLSAEDEGLMSDKCAMTSDLKVTNRMILMLDNEEKEDPNVTKLCANATYDLSVRVKGSLFLDSIAPLDVNGSCINDWLLYGDTSDVSSLTRYGYKYSDIKKVIKDILRGESLEGLTNVNQHAPSLASINRNVLKRMQTDQTITFTTPGHTADHPYDILEHLVNNGFLTLYQSKITASVAMGDSLRYVIFPILGTGSEDIYKNHMEVCPTPMVIKLKPDKGGGVPLIVGGIQRDSTQLNLPVEVLVNERTANDQISLYIDSIMPSTALHSVTLLSTDDPDYYEGVHRLNLEPDRVYNFGGDNSGYYIKGHDIVLHPSPSNNYQMRQGYHYTFGIIMQGLTGSLTDDDGCPIGTIPFTLGIVPDYLRWAPQSAENNQWNNPDNWIGVDANNNPIPAIGRFAPLASTDVIIPGAEEGMPYPHLPDLLETSTYDSIQKVGFVYNICDDIRFLPGAAINQQQNLSCDVTVVDMTMPYNKWALCSAPVAGMLSGDIFMADADLSGDTKTWSVGTFDANGRNYKTGNATFWLSLYDREITQIGNGEQVADTVREAAADWSKLANGLTESLAPAQGWAVYARTKSEQPAVVRLPKNDDVYYYYYSSGGQSALNESGLRAQRDVLAGGSGMAGKLAFQSGSGSYSLTNGVASTSFVFGNPTMGYIDIWGFIEDNDLVEEIDYINTGGVWCNAVTKATAAATKDTITRQERYLPPMHAMVVKVASAATTKAITLNANRIVTAASQIARASAPSRRSAVTGYQSSLTKGIMTVTAINPAGAICTSRLLLGQGYHDDVLRGEDAMLTTVNLHNYSSATPSTPFNIYAVEGGYGLSIDLRDSIMNIPISFSMSNLPFEPETYLWFTGVNSIDGPLVLYDALMDIEQPIIDGKCIVIETPEFSHQTRYYIRRPGYSPETGEPVTTGVGSSAAQEEQALKIIHHGNVYILRNGHVYSIFGQKVR